MKCLVALQFLVQFAARLTDVTGAGILYPQESKTRQFKDLNGLWNFRADDSGGQQQGFDEQWYAKQLTETGQTILMPVPSSYNDITQEAKLRDHIGWVWYDREFFAPSTTNEKSIFIRFGSVNYHAVVWVNGQKVTEHSGGYLPFEADITSFIVDDFNRVTVAINNTLTPWTLPQGTIQYFNQSSKYPAGYHVQNYDFDFFNYAGIHRSVFLCTVPRIHIDDVQVVTDVSHDKALVFYSVVISGMNASDVLFQVDLYDAERRIVGSAQSDGGMIVVTDPHLWWPRGMSSQVAYLYTLHIQLKDKINKTVIDSYRLRIGIRTLNWDSNGVYINGKSIYFKGFGRHEDAILRGKGLDLVTLAKDFNLMQWTEANSFRTSHYPYSEELMDLADQMGWMIIDEIPAVSLDNFDDRLLSVHMQQLEELYGRDKNRPSVVMWSVGNEPRSQKPQASSYFRQIADKMRTLESRRPITLVLSVEPEQDVAGQFFDVTCFNRYYSWYHDTGHLELITYQLINEATLWRNKYQKPVLMTEYGADTVSGLHSDPPFVWTEDYQVELMSQYFKGFDYLYDQGFFIGEMIWNFADFATPQGTTRVVTNRKGIFTRERQPKASARHLKQRYTNLVH